MMNSTSGMVMVPREPTPEMLKAAYQVGMQHLFGDWSNAECKTEEERADKSNAEYYRAMIASAPQAVPQPLTDDQRMKLAREHGVIYTNRHFVDSPAVSFSFMGLREFVEDIERAHGITAKGEQ